VAAMWFTSLGRERTALAVGPPPTGYLPYTHASRGSSTQQACSGAPPWGLTSMPLSVVS
jgi:hypothetical protein